HRSGPARLRAWGGDLTPSLRRERLWLAPVPGQQLVETSDRMVGDAGEDIGQPGLRIDVVELGGHDQAVQEGGALTASVGAGEQPSLPSESQAAQRPLGGIIGQADAAVLEEAGEGSPALEVVHGAGD